MKKSKFTEADRFCAWTVGDRGSGRGDLPSIGSVPGNFLQPSENQGGAPPLRNI
jgi:hypothetical protein